MKDIDPKKNVIPPKEEINPKVKKEEGNSKNFAEEESLNEYESDLGQELPDSEEGGSGWYPPEDDE